MSEVSGFGVPEKESYHVKCPKCHNFFVSCTLCGFALHCPCCDKICRACYELEDKEEWKV